MTVTARRRRPSSKEGFSRVVYRENSPSRRIEEIASCGCTGSITRGLCHGALCYCYSGQCLLYYRSSGSGEAGDVRAACRNYKHGDTEMDVCRRPESRRVPRKGSLPPLDARDLAISPRLGRIVRAPVASAQDRGGCARRCMLVVTSTGVCLDAIASGVAIRPRRTVSGYSPRVQPRSSESYISGASEIMARDRRNRGHSAWSPATTPGGGKRPCAPPAISCLVPATGGVLHG